MVVMNDKWVVCYWVAIDSNKTVQRFEQFGDKEDMMYFVQDMVDNGTDINDIIVFPPFSSLIKRDIKNYNVPELFR
jgi:hypothetical protein